MPDHEVFLSGLFFNVSLATTLWPNQGKSLLGGMLGGLTGNTGGITGPPPPPRGGMAGKKGKGPKD